MEVDMKKQRSNRGLPVVVGMLCGVLCYSGDFGPMGKGSRSRNKEGNVLVSYDREGNKKYAPGVALLIAGNENQFPELKLPNCLEFVDAKLDKQRNKIAVVYFDGVWLVYQRYSETNMHWEMEGDVKLVEYNLDFVLYGNRLELHDFNALRASFIKKGEVFGKGGRQKGIESPGDKVFLIRVTDSGKVSINDQPRRSLQWHPER
jgi:hypothetical protein